MVCLDFRQVGKGADILPISAAWDIAFQQSYPPPQWMIRVQVELYMPLTFF